jgi:hypothetical protein
MIEWARHDAAKQDMDLRDLSVRVSRHEALAQKLHVMHLCFVAASPVVSAPVSPDRTAEIFRRPRGLVSGDRASGNGLTRLRVRVPSDDGQPCHGIVGRFGRQSNGIGFGF